MCARISFSFMLKVLHHVLRAFALRVTYEEFRLERCIIVQTSLDILKTMANRPIHFEVQADDGERAKKFYEAALGWKIEKNTMPGVGMDYWMIMTGDGPGIDGGMYKRADNPMRKLNSFDCTILVDDIDKVIAAIKANGGTIQPF